MATLNVVNQAANWNAVVNNILLNVHTPLDVMKKIVEQDAARKPPPGTIWIMRIKGWQFPDPEIDHWATCSANNINVNTVYEVFPLKK